MTEWPSGPNEEPDEWSRPSIYGEDNRPMAPPSTAGADPVSALLVEDWVEAGHDADTPWSQTRYVGPRRYRPVPPVPGPAAQVVEDADLPATTPPPDDRSDRSDKGLLVNSKTMAVASLASRLTGFLRSSLLVAALGVGRVGDAYNVANNFPNMVYELLLGGVLSSVLIPLLIGAQEDDEDGGVGYTQRLLSIATAALGVVTMIAVLCAPLLAAGFVPHAQERSLASIFATLLLPEIFFYGLGAMFMAVLNIRHSFGPGAWSPVLNNAVMIVTLAVFWVLPGPNTLSPASITTAQVLVLGIGTTLGIAAQALVLVPALRRSGFHWQWRFRARPNEVGRMKDVATLAFWVLGYVVASQIGVTVIAKVGVAHRAFTVFTNADLLVQMPYGVLVVSLLTALMPRLSRAAAREQTERVVDDLALGARLSAVALVPITAGLIVLGPVLSVVLFAYGQTSVDGARLIGTALAASAFGLFPFALVMLQLRVFYAMRDGRTPTLINIFMVGTKVLVVLVCARLFDTQAGVAIALTTATSGSYVVGAVVGHLALTRRLGGLRFAGVLATLGRIAVASTFGGLAAYAVVRVLQSTLGNGHVGSLVALVAGGTAGLAVLVAAVWRMRIAEISDIVGILRRG